MRKALLLLAAVALPAADRVPGTDALAKELRGRVPDREVDCINPHDIQSTRVIDGKAIVYDTGDRLYVNRPGGAEHLRSDDALVQRIEGGQLCRIDSITLLDTVTRMPRGFVVLGPFQSYRRAR